MSESNGNGYFEERPVSYTRVRIVATKLEIFTPQGLADGLGVTYARAEEFISALAWQGLLLPEVDWMETPDGDEPIYTMVPAPQEIYKRNRYTPPEIMAVMELYGGFLLYDERGVSQRLTNKGEKGRVMSTPGARQKQKLRDLAWNRMQDAIRNRVEKERRRRIAESQGKRYFDREVVDATGVEKQKKPKKAGRKTK